MAPPVHKPLCFFLCPPTTPQAMALEAETFRYVCVCWCLRRCCGWDVPLRVLSSARRSALSPLCSAAHARVHHLSPTSAHPAPSCPPNRLQQSAPCRVLPALCGGSLAAPRHTTPPSCPSPITCSPLLHLSPPPPPSSQSEGVRPDGRTLQQFRHTTLNLGKRQRVEGWREGATYPHFLHPSSQGSISTADGSALVRIGQTSVSCGIKAVCGGLAQGDSPFSCTISPPSPPAHIGVCQPARQQPRRGLDWQVLHLYLSVPQHQRLKLSISLCSLPCPLQCRM